MFPQTIKQWFWDSYDHMVRLLVANVLAFVILGGSAFFALLAFATFVDAWPVHTIAPLLLVILTLLAPIWLTLWFASFGYFAEQVAKEKDPGFRVFLQGLRVRGWRTWKYFQFSVFVIVILLANVWFYSFSGLFPQEVRIVGYVLSGICFWLLIFFLVSMVVGIPLSLRGSNKTIQTIKLSLIAVLKHPLYIITIFLFLLGLWILGVLLRFVGIMLFGFAGTMMLLNSTYDVLVAREEEKERAAKDADKQAPSSWKEIEQANRESEEQRMNAMRYNRTIRDILKPWES